MSKAMEWWSKHPILLTTLIGIVIIVTFVWLIHTTIPNCAVCGQKEYSLEVDYYITTFIKVGDVDVPQQTPVYKSVRHICLGRR